MRKDLNTVYRPQNWRAFKGQEKIVQILKNQAKDKEWLPYSYIFCGPSGVGKTTLARLFFRVLNCSNLTEDGDPCLRCEECKRGYYNLTEVNAADTRGIDDIRKLIDSTRFMIDGKYKVILLDECHMLPSASCACLLKPIEEAPEDIIWIFVTSELARLSKTIKTRCQIHKLKSHKSVEIFERLREIVNDRKLEISDNKLRTIAKGSGKNLRQAIHLLEQHLCIGGGK